MVDFRQLWHTTCISLMLITRGLLCGVGENTSHRLVRSCVETGCVVVETRALPVGCFVGELCLTNLPSQVRLSNL